METTLLDHEQFEGAKVLADIGTKIAAGRAALVELEASKRDFLEGRAAEAITRVEAVLADSKALLEECGSYHNELVSFRTQIGELGDNVRGLIQSVERWKSEFNNRLDERKLEIDGLLANNRGVLAQIRQQRALLAGESENIKDKRRSLAEDQRKIDDEWAALTRTAEEIKSKK